MRKTLVQDANISLDFLCHLNLSGHTYRLVDCNFVLPLPVILYSIVPCCLVPVGTDV